MLEASATVPDEVGQASERRTDMAVDKPENWYRDTWAIISRIDGRKCRHTGLSKEWAEESAPEVEALPWVEPGSVSVTDLLPGLQARFPLESRVFLSSRVYWRNGAGTVVEGAAREIASWPEPGTRTPWFFCSSSAHVHVLLDGDDDPSWWSESCLIPASEDA
jgi:hypothetical protein